MNNYILPAVAVIIFNEDGEILFQRRRDTNNWCIICGHVEYGETVENTVIREIKEELNCDSLVVRLIGVYSNPTSQIYRYPDRNVQYITSYFEARLTSDIDLSYTNEETLELKYFHPENLPENMAQLNEYWLKDALSEQNAPFIR